MLELAVKGGIALIHGTSKDEVNIPTVLRASTGVQVIPAPPPTASNSWQSLKSHWVKAKGEVFYAVGDYPICPELYSYLGMSEKVLILINTEEPPSYSFGVGEIPTPRECIRQLLSNLVLEKDLEALTGSLSGLSIKEAGDVAMLTMARDQSLTVRGVLKTRAKFASSLPGLQHVNTSLGVYQPHPELEEWLSLNTKFFLTPPDPRLIPRGLLLNGPPGTGKTTSAKYLAEKLEVPLFRIDVTMALGRYVGESEGRFARILSTLDGEGPAVVLIDEIEKLFTGGGDQGVTEHILGQLLWWLQERDSRLLIIMTTNDMDALPKELYRPGRIDRTMTIPLLDFDQASILAVKVLDSFVTSTKGTQKLVQNLQGSFFKTTWAEVKEKGEEGISHSAVVSFVYDWVKCKLF